MPRSRLRSVVWGAFWLVLLGVAGLGLVITIQGSRFEHEVRREARALLARTVSAAPRPAPAPLPGPVQRYLERAGALRRAPVRNVRLLHGGTFQPTVDGAPFRIRGEQYFTADPPGFVWWGRVRMAPGAWIDARDRSVDGVGAMLVRAVSTLTLVDARGPELDEGALMRLLGELTWYPTALADGRFVSWAPIDDASALARLRVGGREVAATFHFGPDGLPDRVAGERFRDVGGKGVLTPWQGDCADYREVGGLKVPFRMAATWTIDGKPFTYARWEVERLEYDVDGPY